MIARGREGGHRVSGHNFAQFSDGLIMREQGESQGLTLFLLRLQEAWGYVLKVTK